MWIKRKQDEPPKHQCILPMRDAVLKTRAEGLSKVKVGTRPDGTIGDIWACDRCGTVWKVVQPPPPAFKYGYAAWPLPAWQKAGWWLQRKHQPKYGCGCDIGGRVKCRNIAGVIHGTDSVAKLVRRPRKIEDLMSDDLEMD